MIREKGPTGMWAAPQTSGRCNGEERVLLAEGAGRAW